jgi:hypothetical protein
LSVHVYERVMIRLTGIDSIAIHAKEGDYEKVTPWPASSPTSCGFLSTTSAGAIRAKARSASPARRRY